MDMSNEREQTVSIREVRLVRIKGEPRGYDDSFFVTIQDGKACDANETEYPLDELECLPNKSQPPSSRVQRTGSAGSSTPSGGAGSVC
jgi:hypothetical protein